MARLKTDKKLVSFVKFDLINKLVKDKASAENRSESAIIEDILLSNLLPKEDAARYVVENYLYGAECNDIGKTLSALFAINAASVGMQGEAKYDNFKAIVDFAARESAIYNQTILTGKEKELVHMQLQLEAIINVLKIESEKKWGIALLEELKKEPKMARLANIYQLVVNNWEEKISSDITLKKWSITYRLLADLVGLETNWRNSPEVRTELLGLIKKMSSDWKK